MFEMEIFMLDSAQHDNVVKFIGASLSPPKPLIVMELMPTTLKSFLEEARKKNGCLELNSAVNIALSICKGMQHIHQKNIVHRDLKPQNILLTNDKPPKAKIADFGFSRELDEYSGMMTPYRGTLKYMAPELYETVGEAVIADHKVDVFSFSMILWDLLSDCEPFDKLHEDVVQRKMKVEEYRPSLSKIPVEFKVLLESCWNKDSKKRPEFKDIIDTLSNPMVRDPAI